MQWETGRRQVARSVVLSIISNYKLRQAEGRFTLNKFCNMGRYVSFSGSLMCSASQIPIIKKAIDAFPELKNNGLLTKEQIQLYVQGWVFPESKINWMNYVFYGADINEIAIDFMKGQIQLIIDTLKKDGGEDEADIEGLFYLRPEDDDLFKVWVIQNGIISEQAITC